MLTLPQPQAPELARYVEAIRARSRSLKHKFALLECRHVPAAEEQDGHERIELLLRGKTRSSLRLSLWLWDDRWCWFDARRAAEQGWRFTWSFDGRIAPDYVGADLIAALERAHACVRQEPIDAAELDAIWSLLLLRGPRA